MSVDRCRALPRCLSIAVERYHDVCRSLSSATTMSADRCQALPRCLSIAVDRCRPLSRAILAPAEGEAVPQRDFWGLVNERWDGGAELLASGARGAWGRTAGGCLRSLCFAHRTGRAVDDGLGPTCSGTCSAAPASWSGGTALPGGPAAARASIVRAGAELGSHGRAGASKASARCGSDLRAVREQDGVLQLITDREAEAGHHRYCARLVQAAGKRAELHAVGAGSGDGF